MVTLLEDFQEEKRRYFLTDKKQFFEIVQFTASRMPADKPRYLMGVGYPVDILLCACLGVDMFDCVYPTRTARFGTAFTRYGNLKLTNSKCKFDFNPIEEGCECEVACQ
jgi:queuine tRNA-ribosyltransferase